VGRIGGAIGATAASAALRKADEAKHGHDDAPQGEPTGRGAVTDGIGAPVVALALVSARWSGDEHEPT
jgi:hypothetical protein